MRARNLERDLSRAREMRMELGDEEGVARGPQPDYITSTRNPLVLKSLPLNANPIPPPHLPGKLLTKNGTGMQRGRGGMVLGHRGLEGGYEGREEN
jgi:hypothetical protein